MNVIEVSHVSKRFLLGSGSIKNTLLDRHEKRGREFWALDDVSFAITQGSTVGIVGHNGSGKSTMLKLLTNILKPTRGSVRSVGRIGALIEVGAGFHPDLTGRENVYLNGSILGLSRKRIAEKFDEIVDFAGLEPFIDTAVKRYSSGMYARLGFAIAINIDPDILLVDEVLAVGDQMFQNKCMRRMKEFAKNGGTVVFVSHAMSAVTELCEQCVWLDHGRLLYQGPTSETVDRYLAVVKEREDEEFKRRHPDEWAIQQEERRQAAERRRQAEDEEQRAQEAARQQAQEEQRRDAEAAERQAEAERQKADEAKQRWKRNPDRCRVLGATLLTDDGMPQTLFSMGEPLRVQIAYRFTRRLPNPAFCVEIFRSDGLHVFTTSNYEQDLVFTQLPPEGRVAFEVPMLSLTEGRYRIQLRLFGDWADHDWESCLEDVLENAAEFTVLPGRSPSLHSYLPVRWQAVPVADPVLALAG